VCYSLATENPAEPAAPEKLAFARSWGLSLTPPRACWDTLPEGERRILTLLLVGGALRITELNTAFMRVWPGGAKDKFGTIHYILSRLKDKHLVQRRMTRTVVADLPPSYFYFDARPAPRRDGNRQEFSRIPRFYSLTFGGLLLAFHVRIPLQLFFRSLRDVSRSEIEGRVGRKSGVLSEDITVTQLEHILRAQRDTFVESSDAIRRLLLGWEAVSRTNRRLARAAFMRAVRAASSLMDSDLRQNASREVLDPELVCDPWNPDLGLNPDFRWEREEDRFIEEILALPAHRKQDEKRFVTWMKMLSRNHDLVQFDVRGLLLQHTSETRRAWELTEAQFILLFGYVPPGPDRLVRLVPSRSRARH